MLVLITSVFFSMIPTASCRWLLFATRFPLHLIQEQNLARRIFGNQLGEVVFSEVIKAATASSMAIATSLLSYKRIPEKVEPATLI